jgi:xanthine dehydrogenase accessory factor
VKKELELWQFIASRLKNDESVMLLVVAESSGSSPGRAGYKMAVAADGELCGSIGGGVMEVRLVEQAKVKSKKAKGKSKSALWDAESAIVEQVHRRDATNSSGMICSGRQTVIFKMLMPENADAVRLIIDALENRTAAFLTITSSDFNVLPSTFGTPNEDFQFERPLETEFTYREILGQKKLLYIIGGGHCALALSELMSRLNFQISIFDDRPELNTLEKNRFAHEIKIIGGYERIGELVLSGTNVYVVVMTLGYAADEIVIRSLLDKDFKYFGVLGSKAKMAVLLKALENEGFAPNKLDKIHTPIGLPINSHTPEEIAVSIAAEIISVKNSA